MLAAVNSVVKFSTDSVVTVFTYVVSVTNLKRIHQKYPDQRTFLVWFPPVAVP